MTTARMRCSLCGTEMNHHADKLVEATTAAEQDGADLALGGIVDETHACPNCGNVQSRRSEVT